MSAVYKVRMNVTLAYDVSKGDLGDYIVAALMSYDSALEPPHDDSDGDPMFNNVQAVQVEEISK